MMDSSTDDAIELAPPPAAAREEAHDEVALDASTAAEEEQRGLVTGLRRSNRRLRAVLFGALALAALVGSALGVYYGVFYQADGMTVEQHSDTAFAATYHHQGQEVHVLLRNTPVGEPNVLDWTFSFNGKERAIDYHLDMEARVLRLAGHGVVLTREEKVALRALRADLAAFVASSAGESAQEALNVGLVERVADYLSQAPRNHPIPDRVFQMGGGGFAGGSEGAAPDEAPQRGSGTASRAAVQAWEQDDGVQCLQWGSVQQARFDDRNGGNWYWNHVVGTDSVCTGRCGAGCNWLDKEAFQDCMDHDLCHTAFGGSILFDNDDCGDEFNHAADDYIASYGWFC